VFQADVVSPGRARTSCRPGASSLIFVKVRSKTLTPTLAKRSSMARALAIGVSPALALSMPAPWFRYLMLRGDYSCSITCRQC